MVTVTLAGVLVIPVIVGLVQVIKKVGLADRFVPLLAVALGLVFFWWDAGVALGTTLVGISTGLSAVGLYEVGKTTVMGK